jgi:hypothetical protein
MTARKKPAVPPREAGYPDAEVVDALVGKSVGINETGTTAKGELSGLLNIDGVHAIIAALHEAGFKVSKA